jgi:anti-sigma factor RsiW
MSDRTNGQRKLNGDSDPTRRGSLDGVHPTDEQLNAMLDDALEASDRAEVERHVDECATCQTHLTELRGVTAMLRALPEPRLRRSFQLGPEHQRSNDSIWTRLSSWLLPALPALRATTVAVALLLAAVSIRNIVDDPAERGGDSNVALTTQSSSPSELPTERSFSNSAALQTNQQTAAPTVGSAADSQPVAEMPNGEEQDTSANEPPEQGSDPGDTTLAESEAPAAEQASDAALAQGSSAETSAKSAAGADTSTFAENETGEDALDQETSGMAPAGGSDGAGSQVTGAEENIAMSAAAPSSPSPVQSPSTTPVPPTATSTPTATATPTPSPSATPAPQPTATQAPIAITASTNGGSIDRWEAIQLILAVALIFLIALLLVLHRFRLDRRTIAR